MLDYLNPGNSTSQKEYSIDKYWKILVVDDIEDVFKVTKLALKDKMFFKRKLQFLFAQNIPDAKTILKENKDIVIALIDVKMEEDNSGLQLVTHIRDELKNKAIQLIIRTGYAGGLPEDIIYNKYAINDYVEKETLTAEKFELRIANALRVFELKNRNKILDAFMEYTPNYSYIKNSEGKYEIACKTMTDMFGLDKRDEIIGKTDKELFDNLVEKGEIDKEQANRIVASIQEDNDYIFKGGNNMLSKDYTRTARYKGKIKEIHISATKVKLNCEREDGGCIVGIGKDISDIKTFISNIFHTLRNTSAKLNQTIETAFSTFLIKNIEEYFILPNDGTNISINRYDFYKTLLLFRNRIHKLQFFLSTSALDIKELKNTKEISIKKALDRIINIEHYDLELKKPDVKILFNSSFIDYKLFGDKDKLDLCFYNIIDNAIKYSLKINGAFKNIEIASEDTEKVYILKIVNFGKTIKEEEILNIFDQYKRGSVSIDFNIEGSGFGLYITRKILKLHNATIEMIVDEIEKKTTLIVKFYKLKQN